MIDTKMIIWGQCSIHVCFPKIICCGDILESPFRILVVMLTCKYGIIEKKRRLCFFQYGSTAIINLFKQKQTEHCDVNSVNGISLTLRGINKRKCI